MTQAASATQPTADGPAAVQGPTTRVLVVGYGSTLRGDDGVGPRAAELAMEDGRIAGATILLRHQLTPELAADMATARLVILVDARADAAPGSVSIERVGGGAAEAGPGSPPGSDAGATTHHVGAAEVVALARDLWGASPEVFAVGVGAASFEVGDGLSGPVEHALPAVLDAIAALVREHGRA